MMQRIGMTLLSGLLLFAPLPTSADERGTAEEAQALVEKAIDRYKEVGAEKSFAEISDPKGPFVDRDLYVFVVAPDKKMVARGADQTAIGSSMVGVVDAFGNRFGDKILAATSEGSWVDYRWKNYVTGKNEQKSSFVKNVDGYIFGCGYYKL